MTDKQFNSIKLDDRMSFPGHPSKEEMDKKHSFHSSVANLLFQEHLGEECAVAVRRWYLENNVLHPDDSAPMGMLHNGDPAWSTFNDQTGGQGEAIDRQARAEIAQRRICKALRVAVDRSEVPLIDMIQAAIPDDWDDKNGIDYMLDLALFQPEKEVE